MSEETQETSGVVNKLAKVVREHRSHSNGFWTLNIGHLTTIVCAIIPAIIIFAKMSERTTENAKAIEVNAQVISRMDREGTKASQLSLQLDHQIVMAHESRLQRTEDAISSIAVMKEQISRISDDIKSIKPRP